MRRSHARTLQHAAWQHPAPQRAAALPLLQRWRGRLQAGDSMGARCWWPGCWARTTRTWGGLWASSAGSWREAAARTALSSQRPTRRCLRSCSRCTAVSLRRCGELLLLPDSVGCASTHGCGSFPGSTDSYPSQCHWTLHAWSSEILREQVQHPLQQLRIKMVGMHAGAQVMQGFLSQLKPKERSRMEAALGRAVS